MLWFKQSIICISLYEKPSCRYFIIISSSFSMIAYFVSTIYMYAFLTSDTREQMMWPKKNARFSHENSKLVWNLDLEARDRESARAKERDFSPSLALELSHSRASRFLKPVNFRHVWGFHVKTSRFYFQIKKWGSRSWVAPTKHHIKLFENFRLLFIHLIFMYEVGNDQDITPAAVLLQRSYGVVAVYQKYQNFKNRRRLRYCR